MYLLLLEHFSKKNSAGYFYCSQLQVSVYVRKKMSALEKEFSSFGFYQDGWDFPVLACYKTRAMSAVVVSISISIYYGWQKQCHESSV